VRSLQWTGDQSVFLPDLDEQHQAIFLLLEELRHALLEGEAAIELEARVQCLGDQASEHLRHEERLMREARYPQLEWHKRQHTTARALLTTLAEAIRSSSRDLMFDSLEAIAKWTRDHTGVADRMAGAYLRNHMRGSAR
jgi:hemerythrin-like metal-binding protein